MPLGYDNDGRIIENEAAVVKYVFEKYVEYSNNPPADMVEAKIEEAKENGKELSYEDAAKLVTTLEIEYRIWDEIRSKPEFAEVIIAYNRRIGFDSTPNKIIGKICNSATDSIEPIIAKEAWKKVQAARSPKVAVNMRIETESQSILTASSNRVVGTREELEAFNELLDEGEGFDITM